MINFIDNFKSPTVHLIYFLLYVDNVKALRSIFFGLKT